MHVYIEHKRKGKTLALSLFHLLFTLAGVILNCGPTSMIATIDKSLIRDGRPSDLHLLDSLCFARVSGRNLILEASYGECGTMKEVNVRVQRLLQRIRIIDIHSTLVQ